MLKFLGKKRQAMTELLQKIRERAAFDGESHLKWLTEERRTLEPSPQANARWQHSQDLLLIEALIQAVEKADEALGKADWSLVSAKNTNVNNPFSPPERRKNLEISLIEFRESRASIQAILEKAVEK